MAVAIGAGIAAEINQRFPVIGIQQVAASRDNLAGPGLNNDGFPVEGFLQNGPGHRIIEQHIIARLPGELFLQARQADLALSQVAPLLPVGFRVQVGGIQGNQLAPRGQRLDNGVLPIARLIYGDFRADYHVVQQGIIADRMVGRWVVEIYVEPLDGDKQVFLSAGQLNFQVLFLVGLQGFGRAVFNLAGGQVAAGVALQVAALVPVGYQNYEVVLELAGTLAAAGGTVPVEIGQGREPAFLFLGEPFVVDDAKGD